MTRQTRSGRALGFSVKGESSKKSVKKAAGSGNPLKSKQSVLKKESTPDSRISTLRGKRHPSDSHVPPVKPVPRASRQRKAEKAAEEEGGEEVQADDTTAAVAPPDPALVLSTYSDMADLLNRGEWAAFKKAYESRECMKIIQGSPHAAVLLQGITMRLQRFREQNMQQQGAESEGEDVFRADSADFACVEWEDLQPVETRTQHEMDVDVGVDVDDEKQQDELAIKIVAEAIGQQLHQLLQDKIHDAVPEQAGTTSAITSEAGTASQEEEEGAADTKAKKELPDATVDIRSRPLDNAISRAGKRCKIDSKSRLASRPAVVRDTYGYGGTVRVKWSADEERALISGLTKYKGLKWAAILKDPEFATKLALRKNTDLKDKYLVLRRRGDYDFTELDRAIAGGK